MGKACGELTNRGEPVRPFNLLETILQLPVDLRELCRGHLQFLSLFHAPVSEDTRNGADQQEDDDLGVLVHGVVRVEMVPCQENVRYVAESRQGGCDEAAAPTEENGGVDDRQIVESLEQFMPKNE